MCDYWSDDLYVPETSQRERKTERENLCIFSVVFYPPQIKGNWKNGEKKTWEKEKEAVQLFKTVINLDLVNLLRAPCFEEGMAFSDFNLCSAIGFTLLLAPWELQSCSFHNSVLSESLAFKPKGHEIGNDSGNQAKNI